MRYFYYLFFFTLCSFSVIGQSNGTWEKGTVSFLSTKNVYVKFASTKSIKLGDTLFLKNVDEFIPAVVVNNKSSTSIVSSPISTEEIKVGTELFAKVIVTKKEEKVEQPITNTEEEMTINETVAPGLKPEEVIAPSLYQQKIKARISAASYSNFSDYKNTHRMRYAFNLSGHHLKNSKFSVDNYITFRHTLGEWQQVQENLAFALKIYSLSVKYDIDSTAMISLGRRINPKISSIGAIDGLQYERGFGHVILGAIAGSRPDFTDYSINFNLFQAGAYVSLLSSNPVKYRQTTLGFMEQRNKSNVDRRFIYFQHSGELLKYLNLFGSFELDLYENINQEVSHQLRLTNLYLSLRYRLSKKFQLSAAYDNRKNIIYYEAYKSFIERLIEDETRQGLRFGFNYRPFKYISWGVNSSWRFQQNSTNDSKNLNTYVNISKIPVVNMSASIRANLLQTNYLDSKIFGIGLSKELIKGKLNGETYYRRVYYFYKNSETSIQQNIAGGSLSLQLLKILTLYFYYEGTFDSKNQAYQRFNTKIIQRF